MLGTCAGIGQAEPSRFPPRDKRLAPDGPQSPKMKTDMVRHQVEELRDQAQRLQNRLAMTVDRMVGANGSMTKEVAYPSPPFDGVLGEMFLMLTDTMSTLDACEYHLDRLMA